MSAPNRPALEGPYRPSRARSRAARTFAAAAIGAAVAAWLPVAHAPQPTSARAAPSYGAMAEALAALYPSSRPHALRIVRAVHEESDRHGLDPCLVMGIIARESSFEPRARNRRDVGLMQVNLDWHPDLVGRAGGAQALLDPVSNVRAGTELLARYRRLSDDDRDALRRYHGLGKRNDYVERVRATARRLAIVGACVGDDAATVAAR